MGVAMLTDRQVRLLGKSGKVRVDKSLYIQITPSRRKSWFFKFNLNAKSREMGLGSYPTVTLAEARRKAKEARHKLSQGIDPISARDASRQTTSATKHTFKAVAAAYLKAHQVGWKNEKHREQWINTLETYAYPIIGSMQIHQIATEDVHRVLIQPKDGRPLWETRTETASRIRQRIRTVWNFGKAKSWCGGDNPAEWEALEPLLPDKAKVSPVRHFAALPYHHLPAFYERLIQRESDAARALQFIILTATRTNEVLAMRWLEVDLKFGVWIIPAPRMKGGREHRVPLNKPAIDLLVARYNDDIMKFVFGDGDRPLSNMSMLMLLRRMGSRDLTVHGFRSTFRDWAAEETHYQNHVLEMALAHTIENKAEASYRRGDLFSQRMSLMADWGAYCSSK
jgi:integrase